MQLSYRAAEGVNVPWKVVRALNRYVLRAGIINFIASSFKIGAEGKL